MNLQLLWEKDAAVSTISNLLALDCFECVGCVCVTMTHHLESSVGWKGKQNVVRLLLIHFRNTWEVSQIFI